MLAQLRERFATYSAQELSTLFEKNGLPYAPIKKPHELVDDPHLLATGGLAPMTLPSGQQTNTVLLPFTMDGQRMGVRHSPPKVGEHSSDILQSLGYSAQEAAQLSATTPT